MPKIKKEKLQKILGYGLIASSALAMTTNAQAAVHYSGEKNFVVDADNDTIYIDLNEDGTNDFRFNFYSTHSSGTITSFITTTLTTTNGATYQYTFTTQYFYGGQSAAISIRRLSYNEFIVSTYQKNPARLLSDFSINNNLPTSFSWNTQKNILALTSSFYYLTTIFSTTDGNFLGERGYIGVRFHSADCTGNNYHYGWIQFEAAADASSGTIIDWAYEDECNVPIKAGQTEDTTPSSSSNTTPVPLFGGAGLAGLAALLGAAGVAGIRKKEEKEKNN